MPIWVVIAIAVVALLAIFLAGARLLGFSPLGRLHPLRASAAEAADRTADTAAEFWEWLRLGR